MKNKFINPKIIKHCEDLAEQKKTREERANKKTLSVKPSYKEFCKS